MRSSLTAVGAPKAVGPYCHAVKASGSFLFLSGQLALDPSSGQMVGGGDAAAETRQVLANIDAVLKEAGLTAAHIVKTTVFLADMADFKTMNVEYEAFFGTDNPPARSAFQVAALPLGGKVEIECVAVMP